MSDIKVTVIQTSILYFVVVCFIGIAFMGTREGAVAFFGSIRAGASEAGATSRTGTASEAAFRGFRSGVGLRGAEAERAGEAVSALTLSVHLRAPGRISAGRMAVGRFTE